MSVDLNDLRKRTMVWKQGMKSASVTPDEVLALIDELQNKRDRIVQLGSAIYMIMATVNNIVAWLDNNGQ